MPPMMQAIVQNLLSSRADLIRKASGLDGRRDMATECNYPARDITTYKQMYDEQGIAKRAVNLLPEECWETDPDIYETEKEEETEWEKAWKSLVTKHNVYHYLQRIDEMSGIGTFGLLLIGLDDGKELKMPVKGITDDPDDQEPQKYKILFLRTYDQSLVTISAYETRPSNPRFGLPTMYNINMVDPSTAQSQGIVSQPALGTSTQVHWTRVLHIADGCRNSEVFGTPRLEDIFDRICDIRKILSGSGEMFWKGAFPGYSFEVNPDVVGSAPPMDVDALREEFERYSEGLQRYLGLTGVSAKSLAVQVATPKDHLECQIDAIAISKATPKRILAGSERGELGSSQDAMTWNDRVASRQRKYVNPFLLRPFILRAMAYGAIPTVENFHIDWPDLNAPDDETKAKTALAIAQTLAAYLSSGADQIIPPLEFFTTVLGWPLEKCEAIIKAAMELVAEQDAYATEAQAEADARALAQASAAGKDPLGKPNPTPVGTVPEPRAILPPKKAKGGGKPKQKAGV